jgi:pyrimidine-nucleoside phosphorylase
VDKHSTGGVGDKTSLVLAPMVAACGVPVAKMSGRGLGHTGGTIDKLESIKGFSVEMTRETFINNVNTVGLAIGGQTGNLVPADKKLYALRDVTATVDNLSLIASSIMSKKLASGADAIVLDVKVGSGAFMKNVEDAFDLAKEMVDIGTAVGRKTVAIISDMDQPLGNAVGNSIEVMEAIDTLKGHGPCDLYNLCLTLGSQMLILSGKANDPESARNILQNCVSSGAALRKFKEFIVAQGGNPEVIDNTELLPKAQYIEDITASEDGYISRVVADEVGMASLLLGAGRETKESTVDLSVGLLFHKKVGDSVLKGGKIATIYGNNHDKMNMCKERLLRAINISKDNISKNKLIYGVVTKNSSERF